MPLKDPPLASWVASRNNGTQRHCQARYVALDAEAPHTGIDVLFRLTFFVLSLLLGLKKREPTQAFLLGDFMEAN